MRARIAYLRVEILARQARVVLTQGLVLGEELPFAGFDPRESKMGCAALFRGGRELALQLLHGRRHIFGVEPTAQHVAGPRDPASSSGTDAVQHSNRLEGGRHK